MAKIVELETHDVRFPTSRHLDGSDAMSPSPDYSAAYVVLRTDDGADGHALAFTVGRGNEVQVAGIRALAPLVVGRDVDGVLDDLGAFARGLTGDSQLRWLGPEKGVIHMAAGAVVNAAWDLRAVRAGQPLWGRLPRPRGPAPVAAAAPLVARGDRRPRGLPLPPGRAAARRGPGHPPDPPCRSG